MKTFIALLCVSVAFVSFGQPPHVQLAIKGTPGVDEPFDPNTVGPKWLPGKSNPEWDFEEGATFELWFKSENAGDVSIPKVSVRRVPAPLGQDQFLTYVGWLPAKSVFEDPSGGICMVLATRPPADKPGAVGVVDLREGTLWWIDAKEMVRPAISSNLSFSVYSLGE